MIRDPSDGSVKPDPISSGPAVNAEVARGLGPGYTTASSQSQRPSDRDGIMPQSGLPPTSAKAAYLARLEASRVWLTEYHKPVGEK
jgi:hypothetical protein